MRRPKTVKSLHAPAAAAAWLLAVCSPASTATADSDQIVVADFAFQPATLTVEVGATVTWLNKDEEPHTVSSDTGLFRSGALDTRGTFQFRFDKAGTYHYLCSIHPHMTGTIVVR